MRPYSAHQAPRAARPRIRARGRGWPLVVLIVAPALTFTSASSAQQATSPPAAPYGQAGYSAAPAPHGITISQGYAGQRAAARPGAGTCFDGQQNGQESDVDCGGDCSPCEVGDACREWRDCWSGRCASNACEERPYTAGDPIPPGYDVETSNHDGAATARYFGVGFFGLGYGAAYVGALADPSRLSWLFVPLVGPWISLGQVESGKILLVIDGVLQAAGGLVLFGGLLGSGEQLVRQGAANSARLEPRLTPYLSARGAGLLGSF